MKSLFRKGAVLIFILIVCDLLAEELLDYLRDYSPDGRYYKAKYSLETCREEVIILGSSRGETNIVPRIVEDSLHLSCWNASRGGQGLPFFRCMQEGILSRYAPKIVILNIDPDMLERAPHYEEAGFLRPFYRSHREIQPILNRISPFEKYFMLSRLYAYNSSFYYLIRPYFIGGLDGDNADKGWKPRAGKTRSLLSKGIETVSTHEPLNKEAVEELECLVDKFKQRGCRIYLVVSPDYCRSVRSSTTMEYLQRFSGARHIPLLVHASDTSIIAKAEYFVDPDHLNRLGAAHFTRKLIKEIHQDYISYK